MFVEITSHLALLEEKQGNYPQALAYMELWKTRSASPDGVQKYIDEVRRKMSSAGQTRAGGPGRGSGKTP
jgi:hypothetical protein